MNILIGTIETDDENELWNELRSSLEAFWCGTK